MLPLCSPLREINFGDRCTWRMRRPSTVPTASRIASTRRLFGQYFSLLSAMRGPRVRWATSRLRYRPPSPAPPRRLRVSGVRQLAVPLGPDPPLGLHLLGDLP